MKIKFENQNTAQENYPVAEQIKTMHEGREYIRIGKSEENRSVGWRLLRLIELSGMVGFGILLLAVPFAFEKFRQTIKTKSIEIWNGKERIDHYILKAVTREEQLQPILKIAETLHDALNPFEAAHVQFQSAKCFIKIDFAQGSIKKEFILKNQAGNPLDKNYFSQQVDKIKDKLEIEIQENMGEYNQYKWIIIFKDTQNRWHKSSNEERYIRTVINDHIMEERGGGPSLVMQMGQGHLAATYRMIIDQMGFPIEDQVRNGDFVPGTFYQSLEG